MRGGVWIFAALLALLLAAAASGGRDAPLAVGVAEDATKYADDGGASLYERMRDAGLTENRWTVYFDPESPSTIQEQPFLDRAMPVAEAHGVKITLSVHARKARAFSTATPQRIKDFAEYLKLLARTYPSVRNYIVLNEPNEAYFLGPQFSPTGQILSAGLAYRILAAGYDALKSVDRTINVVGLGLSSEANDRTSVSPVRFLKALGAAYRASGRRKPIMDELGFHLYPRDSAKQHDATSFQWPNVGPANLDRIKQAVWDAFHGTAQPTFEQTLRFRIDEVGWQAEVPELSAGSYTGTENVALTNEQRQASIYAGILRRLACDSTVAALFYFHLVDEHDLNRLQTGMLRADGSERPSFAAVRAAIARGCTAPKSWKHATRVTGAKVSFEPRQVADGVLTLGVQVRAEEDVHASMELFPLRGVNDRAEALRRLAGVEKPTLKPVRLAAKQLQAYYLRRLAVSGAFEPGRYVVVVRMRAAMNAARTSTFFGPTVLVRAAA